MRSLQVGEGLGVARFFMVLSSMSPLFILWAIRGNNLVPDQWFIPFCIIMVLLPNTFLWLRLKISKKLHEIRQLTVGTAEDHRDHLLVYLFATLLPFYTADLSSWRSFYSTLAALAFVIFLFWHLNLHYLNLLFAFLGYRVYTVLPPDHGNPLTVRVAYVLITRRSWVQPGECITVYRLSNSVYMEVDDRNDI